MQLNSVIRLLLLLPFLLPLSLLVLGLELGLGLGLELELGGGLWIHEINQCFVVLCPTY